MHVGIDYRPASVAPYSGIGRQVQGLEAALNQREDTQVSLFAVVPENHPLRAKLVCPDWNTPLTGLQQPHKRWRFEAGFLPRVLKERNVDLYIATANMGLPIALRSKNRKQVLLLHDLFQLTEHNHHTSRLKAYIYRILDSISIAWSVRVADQIWCPSVFTANQIKNKFPHAINKVKVLPNLVSGFVQSPEVVDQLPLQYWLLVGTREPRKNIHFFIATWLKLKNEKRVPDLVLVGDVTDFPQYANVPNIRWISGVTEGQLRYVYSSADCLWQPSYAEGFGLPIIEALSVGTPVVTALGSSLNEVSPPNSLRFDPYSAEDLEKCMRNVLDVPQHKNKKDYFDWAEKYNFKNYSENINNLISELFL